MDLPIPTIPPTYLILVLHGQQDVIRVRLLAPRARRQPRHRLLLLLRLILLPLF